MNTSLGATILACRINPGEGAPHRIGDGVTPAEFIGKWSDATLRERQGSQEHFLDLCRLLGQPTPAEDDPHGDRYCFERGATKAGGETGGSGEYSVAAHLGLYEITATTNAKTITVRTSLASNSAPVTIKLPE